MARSSNLPAIRACLFDMDGLLIDSEDKYTICTNEVLQEYGRPNIPWSIKAQMQGRPAPEAGPILMEWAQLPISREEFIAKTITLQQKYFPSTKPLPGVPELLSTLHTQTSPRVQIALATSSHSRNFELKTGHLQELFNVFRHEHRVLGDDPRIPRGRGKPAPDIYLLALDALNTSRRHAGDDEISPEECLVFEDSVPGVESGRRAGMQVVWCPHPGLLNEFKGREKEVLAGLTGEQKEVDEQSDALEHSGSGRRKGMPGEIDDGWANLFETLEGFPYHIYSINVKQGNRL